MAGSRKGTKVATTVTGGLSEEMTLRSQFFQLQVIKIRIKLHEAEPRFYWPKKGDRTPE